MEHLEEAKAHVADANYGDLGLANLRVQRAIAHSLIDIAETLRWLKEQKEYEIQQNMP